MLLLFFHVEKLRDYKTGHLLGKLFFIVFTTTKIPALVALYDFSFKKFQGWKGETCLYKEGCDAL